jgi:hypothetical protein
VEIKTGKAFRIRVIRVWGRIDRGKNDMTRPPWGAAAGVDFKTGKNGVEFAP